MRHLRHLGSHVCAVLMTVAGGRGSSRSAVGRDELGISTVEVVG